MLDRPTLKKPNRTDTSEAEALPVSRTQARPAEERFLLRVDGQAKRSFDDRDVALRAGRDIKKKYPVVVVSVLDTKKGEAEILGEK